LLVLLRRRPDETNVQLAGRGHEEVPETVPSSLGDRFQMSTRQISLMVLSMVILVLIIGLLAT
jgi:hypothetical protein